MPAPGAVYRSLMVCRRDLQRDLHALHANRPRVAQGAEVQMMGFASFA